MPLVLVHNERTAGGDYDYWEDIEGELYHFPHQYKNRILEADRFVYYRGSRAADGSIRAPCYFGVGRVGEVWRDNRIPESEHKQRWRWFCRIEDYRPFPEPVPFKVNGEYIEDIPQNHWGVGVRELSEAKFNRILSLAGVSYPTPDEPEPDEPAGPSVEDTDLEEADDQAPVLLPQPRLGQDQTFTGDPSQAGEPRHSRYANAVGRRAEKLVYQYLSARHESVRWLADEGEKPGWDLQYRSGGKLVRVEVKSSTAEGFTTLELTAREWEAAKEHREGYWLYLVGDCFGSEPRLQKLQDPWGLQEQGDADVSPVTWRYQLLNGGGSKHS